jgi:hypothetical protein
LLRGFISALFRLGFQQLAVAAGIPTMESLRVLQASPGKRQGVVLNISQTMRDKIVRMLADG